MNEHEAHVSSALTLESLPAADYAFSGLLGDRLQANLEQWLLVAPLANPAMLDMFRDRDRSPRRDLVPWAGEFAGKYLTSAVLAWRLDRDERLGEHLARFVAELIAVQDDDGYLGPFPRAARYVGRTLTGEHALWDLWGHYHCMLGLLLWHRETGDQAALGACLRAADAICDRFLGRDPLLRAGAEEMNMAIAHTLGELYLETGQPRYLALLRQVEAEWQIPPAGDYVRQALAGVPFWRMPKPRWESLHDIQAILSLYRITGEAHYREAFEAIWRSIRDGDRHNSGGFSSGERATGNPYDPGAIETCCTVAWMALSVDMLRLSGDSAVADELELSTLNAALGAQSPSGRWWTYNTPMDGVRRASAHDIVFQAREGSPELNCCSVNGPRTLGMLSEWAIMRHPEGPVLNYYGPCALALKTPAGQGLRLLQDTTYPREGHIRLTLKLAHAERFALRLRMPAWSRSSAVRLNSQPVAGVEAGAYLRLEREWTDGDTVELDFDMHLRQWIGEREAQGKVSLYRGPLLLAYDRRFNRVDPDGLVAVNAESLSEVVPWEGPAPAPWLLLRVTSADPREPLFLCDFCTAGATGAPYRTWLPHGG
ncbi:MAG: glycoside hydrolase family 127 protein [Anaerolineae bacterium]|nr:glycoside hydrolase family 127 protein [Anaerolineae bacterium]